MYLGVFFAFDGSIVPSVFTKRGTLINAFVGR